MCEQCDKANGTNFFTERVTLPEPDIQTPESEPVQEETVPEELPVAEEEF